MRHNEAKIGQGRTKTGGTRRKRNKADREDRTRKSNGDGIRRGGGRHYGRWQ